MFRLGVLPQIPSRVTLGQLLLLMDACRSIADIRMFLLWYPYNGDGLFPLAGYEVMSFPFPGVTDLLLYVLLWYAYLGLGELRIPSKDTRSLCIGALLHLTK